MLEAPADDGPRLVYADHLLERGDPRGEYIAAACIVARRTRGHQRATPEFRTAHRRVEQLFGLHGKEWIQPRALRDVCTFDRGFVDSAEASFAQVRSWWPSLRMEPLRRLHLATIHGMPNLGALAWLMQKPTARRLESLALSFEGGGLDLDPRTLAEDLEATRENDTTPSWNPHDLPDERLRRSLRGITVPWDAAGLLARLGEDLVPRLRELRVDPNGAYHALLRQSELTALHATLPASGSGALSVMAAKKIRSLTWMADGEHQRKAAAAQIAEAAFLPHLGTLCTNALLDARLAQALGERATALEELELRGGTDAAALTALAESKVAPRLRVLRVLSHRGSPSSAFLQPRRFKRLETLELDRLVFDETASTFGSPSLVDLVLREARIDADCARRLVASPGLAALYRPVFDGCAIFHAARGLALERWPDAVFR